MNPHTQPIINMLIKKSQASAAHACNPSYLGAEIRKITVRTKPRQIIHKTLAQKYPIQKRSEGVTQVVEHCLASMRS
jgi:hypothetical protein